MHISAKCSVAIHCLVFIHAYGTRTKVTSELLSRSSGVNAVTVRTIFSAFKKEGILSVRPGTGGTVLACPPEEITLYRICKAIEPDFLSKLFGVHGSPSPLCPVGRNIHQVLEHTYRKVRSDLQASLEGITLADMIDDYHRLAGQTDGPPQAAGAAPAPPEGTPQL